jgi:polar amino acid transport system substrate-binding protein
MRRPLLLPWRLICVLVLMATYLGAPAASSAAPRASATPDAAFRQILADARGRAAKSCARPADRLQAVICSGTLRVGVRDNYPLFGFADGDRRSGYEIAIARRIAHELGVKLSLVTVTPADRIALLAEHRIDLAVATMGDTTLRESQALFIRPHYYASHTVVVGPRDVPVAGFAGVASRTVCVTIGDSSNAELSAHGARLMLFESPGQLIEELQAGVCSLVAQDDSFFARYFADPRFSALYDAKFAFAPLPWGMAVAHEGAGQLALALSLLSEIFHRDGVFLELAKENHISTTFLQQRHAAWVRPECNRATGFADPRCVVPPFASDIAPTGFAGSVTAVERLLATKLGLHLTLTIFKIRPAWDLVREGIRNSLILIIGTLLATFGFALLIGRVLSAQTALLRWPVRALVMVLQSTPVVLALVIAAAVANAMFAFSSMLALVVSILALGLINGGNAGQAISEAMASLRAEDAALRPGQPKRHEGHLFTHALRRSITQINAFLINATKGTPVASFIGAPELLNTLTDSTSFSSDRQTTYWLLLIFYVAAVLVVVQLCVVLRGVLERRISAF